MPALALAVAVAGPPGASEALAGLVEGRLAKALPRAGVTADRQGYRVQVLLEGEADVERALAGVRRVLFEPVRGAEEVAAVLERVRARRGHVLDDEGGLALARCTGEARYGASEFEALEAALASSGPLEAWRRRAHGVGALALGLVGPGRYAARLEARLAASPPWPRVEAPSSSEPRPTPSGASFVRTGREPIVRVDLAFRLSDRRLAASIAEELGARPAALASRLRALPQPFVLREAGVTVRAAGACLALRAEGEHAPTSTASLPEEAGAVAGLLRHEFGVLGAGTRADAGALPRQIGAIGDARQAAEAAAWWALSAEGSPQGRSADDGSRRAREAVTSVLTLPAGDAAGHLGPAEAAPERNRELGRRFDESAERSLAARLRPSVDVRGAIERGQGELWIMLASACPLAESAAEAGTTALGATAAALAAPREGGVSVEPWVSAEGAGVVAHAIYARGETPVALAERVATAAARAIAEVEPRPDDVARARALLLGRVEERDEHVRGALAEHLLPSHAATWFPWGLSGALGRVGPETVRARWRRLSAGPLRMAVLAGSGPEQVAAAGRAVERWTARGDGAARCPPREEPPGPGAGGYEAQALGLRGARAYVALPVEASTPAGRAALRATLVLLGPEGGLLGRALGGVAAKGEAFWLGPEPRPLLAVELRGGDEALEPAVAQVRALFERLRRGAIGPDDLARVRGPLETARVEARATPRRRLLDRWRGVDDEPSAPTLEGWRQWLGASFFDERAAVVVVRAPGE
ncbi:MAG: hypothetical protein MUF34_24100 [Polyangiaceae bacterium]|jgi:hypothetical protein|nr:hypothetical protein [Polyangiaceae bacterium]